MCMRQWPSPIIASHSSEIGLYESQIPLTDCWAISIHR